MIRTDTHNTRSDARTTAGHMIIATREHSNECGVLVLALVLVPVGKAVGTVAVLLVVLSGPQFLHTR